MTEVYTIQVRFKGKKTFTVFEDIVEYTFAANQTLLWMKKKGTLDEKNNRFTERLIWYPLSNIDEIILDNDHRFETKQEIFEFKRDMKKGNKTYEQR